MQSEDRERRLHSRPYDPNGSEAVVADGPLSANSGRPHRERNPARSKSDCGIVKPNAFAA
jgi:hypothetical protein